MDVTAKKMIEEVNKTFPPSHQPEIRNYSDLNLEARFGNTYQYIVGITRADKDGGHVGYGRYKEKIGRILASTPVQYHCLGWPFKGDEKEEAVEVLNELSAHFNSDLDIDTMFNKLNIKHNEDWEYFYIVITTIVIPFFTVEQEER